MKCATLEDGPHYATNKFCRNYMGSAEFQPGQPYRLKGTPTSDFGRVDVNLEPLDGKKGWRLDFHRDAGPVPARVSVPLTLEHGAGFQLATSKSVPWKRGQDFATIDPAVTRLVCLHWRGITSRHGYRIQLKDESLSRARDFV